MSSSEFILELKNLSKIYYTQRTSIFGKSKEMQVLDGITFQIRKGEIFGLVGESGCGKSTLARAVVGLTKDTQGEIILSGEDVKKTKKTSEKVQIVFQDPLSSLNPKKKIGWILEEPLKIHKIGNKENRIKRVNQMLELVGLDISYRDRYPQELSGGQRQRISIGSALMLSPKLIIADEPVSALDVSVQSQILNLLMDLHGKLNLSYLFISHNLDVIYYMCDRVAVMYLGKIVEIGKAENIYDNPLHPYTKALLSIIPKVNIEEKEEKIYIEVEDIDSEEVGGGCAYYTRCPISKELCRKKSAEMIGIKGENDSEHFVRCHFV